MELWPPLASELVSIIGENGFKSLFNRSIYLTCQTYPWLASGGQQSPKLQFAELHACFHGQNTSEANAANHTLLAIFTNTLATLIGEPLTITILNSAWKDATSDVSGEELQK